MPTTTAELTFPSLLQGRMADPTLWHQKPRFQVARALIHGPWSDWATDLIDNMQGRYAVDEAKAALNEALVDAAGTYAVDGQPSYASIGEQVCMAFLLCVLGQDDIPVQLVFDVEETDFRAPYPENIAVTIAGVQIDYDELLPVDQAQIEMACERWIEDHWDSKAERDAERADHEYDAARDRRMGL